MLCSLVLLIPTFGFAVMPISAEVEVPVLLTETDLQTIVADNNFVAVFWRSGTKKSLLF